MKFRVDIIYKYLPLLVQGAKLTIQLTLVAVAVGTVIGLLISLLRLSRFKPLSWLAKAYIDFFRGTPLLAQIFLIHFGFPQLFEMKPFAPHVSGLIALSLNSGAYIAEIFRAGIKSIHRGQMEAARSLGMTPSQSMRYIILPQAFKRCIPPLGNEFIAMLKDSSLVSTISVQELMMSSRISVARSFRPFEIYTAAAVLYLIMTLTISQFVSYLERVYSKDDHGE